ncbi:hypothetical protein ABFS82_06G167200 [Erythranthe guttata]
MMIKYVLQTLVICACLFQQGNGCFLFFYNHIKVVVANSLPPNSDPLLLHCASKNDDLGNHTLTINQTFSFEFCVIPWTTLFYCDFRWGSKHAHVDVYDAKWKDHKHCGGDHECGWEARSDGIYLSGTKRFDWQ